MAKIPFLSIKSLIGRSGSSGGGGGGGESNKGQTVLMPVELLDTFKPWGKGEEPENIYSRFTPEQIELLKTKGTMVAFTYGDKDQWCIGRQTDYYVATNPDNSNEYGVHVVYTLVHPDSLTNTEDDSSSYILMYDDSNEMSEPIIRGYKVGLTNSLPHLYNHIITMNYSTTGVITLSVLSKDATEFTFNTLVQWLMSNGFTSADHKYPVNGSISFDGYALSQTITHSYVVDSKLSLRGPKTFPMSTSGSVGDGMIIFSDNKHFNFGVNADSSHIPSFTDTIIQIF